MDIENENEIFPVDMDPDMNKYTRGIQHARVCTYIFGSICLAISFGILLSGYNPGNSNNSTTPLLFMGASGILYILLGLWSRQKPFIPLLMMSVIISIINLAGLLAFFSFSHSSPLFFRLYLVFQLALNYYIVMGAVYANRQMKLTKDSLS